ncbi:phage protein Gp36 family protein [Sulfurimonas sp.]|uniref:phage protein Gp36 family protein n=1 Tax=Sulfurimonas sp. TaxID=2022749 RepID=UPI002600700F|nr:phage protein Gp36 family protein [Sulfurimonas sp.]
MITNEDLLKEISEQELLELSDINATGELNQDVIDDALNDAISFIESFIVLPVDPTTLLKKITTDLTIYELKRKNGLVSDEDKELKKENEAYLTKMSNGRLITQKRADTSSSIPDENKSFAFRHRATRRVKKEGFR